MVMLALATANAMEMAVVESWWTERGYSRAGSLGKVMVAVTVNGLEMLGPESYSLKLVTHRPLHQTVFPLVW